PPPAATLSPYTTLFRSRPRTAACRHPGFRAAAETRRSGGRRAGRAAWPRPPQAGRRRARSHLAAAPLDLAQRPARRRLGDAAPRSEEHTSELQSRENLV